MNPLLSTLIFILVNTNSGFIDEDKIYNNTFSINPFSASFVYISGEGFLYFIPTPAINYEVKLNKVFSLNFELNNAYLIFPYEIEVGIREYVKKQFRGLYIYEGFGSMTRSLEELEQLKNKEQKFLFIIITVGYKAIMKNGFTIDPFLGVKLFYSVGGNYLSLIPVLGPYFGYTW